MLKDIYLKAQNLVVVYEGLHTYGGMAGRDMEALAQGIRESVMPGHQEARIGQVQYLAEKLMMAGIPIVIPCGSHAVFIDAKAFLPHLDQNEYPAQALAAGRDPKTGENRCPELELVRLTISRRVYTQAHMGVVIESVLELYKNRDKVRGLNMVFEPEYLRFFQARFEQK